jgi:hypothetical protein
MARMRRHVMIVTDARIDEAGLRLFYRTIFALERSPLEVTVRQHRLGA